MRPPVRLPLAEAAAELAPGELAAALDQDGSPVVVICGLDGNRYVAEDLCPHDGGLLSDGYVDGALVVCARHNWEFELTTGECPHGRHRKIEIRRIGDQR